MPRQYIDRKFFGGQGFLTRSLGVLSALSKQRPFKLLCLISSDITAGTCGASSVCICIQHHISIRSLSHPLQVLSQFNLQSHQLQRECSILDSPKRYILIMNCTHVSLRRTSSVARPPKFRSPSWHPKMKCEFSMRILKVLFAGAVDPSVGSGSRRVALNDIDQKSRKRFGPLTTQARTGKHPTKFSYYK